MFGSGKTDDEKNQELFEKFGLDIENYSEEDLKKKNALNLKQVTNDLRASGLDKFAVNIGMSSTDRLTVNYLSTLFQTNLILIRQNEIIIRELEKLNKK